MARSICRCVLGFRVWDVGWRGVSVGAFGTFYSRTDGRDPWARSVECNAICKHASDERRNLCMSRLSVVSLDLV